MTYYDIERMGFAIGDRVRVIRQSCYKKYNLLNAIGVVDSHYGYSKIAVKFDGIMNDQSARGVFYFSPADLVVVDDICIAKEENTMPNVTNYFNAVKIKFLDGPNTCGHIYANFEADLKVGDLCVVKPAHHDFALARVVEVIDKNDFDTPREIVAKVQTEWYDERVANRAKAAEIKAKMQERAKQLQDIALYQMLAKDDPAMAALLSEYDAVPKM